jgi:hypothetical protein
MYAERNVVVTPLQTQPENLTEDCGANGRKPEGNGLEADVD